MVAGGHLGFWVEPKFDREPHLPLFIISQKFEVCRTSGSLVNKRIAKILKLWVAAILDLTSGRNSIRNLPYHRTLNHKTLQSIRPLVLKLISGNAKILKL